MPNIVLLGLYAMASPGGHFAIELADATCCHPKEPTGWAVAALTTTEDHCATGCTDTPLGVVTA